jgi:methylated-DNA-[protein]-cysteine S-methyltransferase
VDALLYTTVSSPIGELLVVGDERALRGLYTTGVSVGPEWRRADEPFRHVREQLGEYFEGGRTSFDLPLELEGTPFQRLVWRTLLDIPYGATVSYRELARWIRRPAASRAVGAANGRNPISVIVPCHRVIGADGSLTGYGGGIERKRFLLELEARRPTPTPKTYTLIGPDGRPYESRTPGTLGGHRRQKGYGRLDCPSALRWIAKGHYTAHRVFFADEATAMAAGYRPCAVCMPERYREWKEAGSILWRRAGVAELVDATGLGPVGPKGSWRFESSRPHDEVSGHYLGGTETARL